MRYTVTWSEEATQQAMLLWLREEGDRARIQRASDDIDRRLADDPERVATQILKRAYFVRAAPLWALLEISEPDRMVVVMQIVYEPEK